MKKLDMNLLERYYADQKVKAKKGSSLRAFIYLTLSLIIIAGAFVGKLMLDNNTYKSQIASLHSYLDSGNTQENLAKINLLQSRLDLLDQIETEVSNISDVMDYIPQLDEYVLDVIDEQLASTSKVVLYSYNSNVLSIEISTKYASDFSNTVLHLVDTNVFASVNNDGYSYDDNSGLYTGTIDCMLRGGN